MNRIENATRNKIQKAAKEGSIRVNGIIVKSSYKVKKGDKIRILFTHPPYENLLTPENIELDIERLGENSVQISWSINYDEYDRIVLEVLNQNNSERTRYILPSLKGVVELCCFEGDVGATITVTKSKAVDKSDEDCNALTCIEYVKEDYFNSKIVTAYQPTTTTTSTTTTTIPPTTTTSPILHIRS